MTSRSHNELWQQWRAAESALAQSTGQAGIEAGEALLPERLRWYFRAVALTLAGEGDALKKHAPKAPNVAARALAELAPQKPGMISATDFRAKLKLLGVENAPLPALDFLRLWMAAKNSDRRTRPKKVVEAAVRRPLLDAALTTLTGTLLHLDRREALEERSMHAALAWKAETLRREGAMGIASLLAEEFRRAGAEFRSWQAADWVDLDVPEKVAPPVQRRARRQFGKAMLDQFLVSPATGVWTSDMTYEVSRRGASLTEAEREQLAGRLLEATYLALHGGRLGSARGAVQSAEDLLRDRLSRPKERTLGGQFKRLQAVLSVLLGDPDKDSLGYLWTRTAAMTLRERIALATRLAPQAAEGLYEGPGLGSLLAHALLGDAPAESKKFWLAEIGAELSFAQCEKALKEVGDRWLAEGGDATVLALWRGWMFATIGPPASGLQECLQLLERGDSKELAEPLGVALTQSVRFGGGNRQFQRQLQRTLEALGKKWQTGARVDLQLLYLALMTASNTSGKTVDAVTLAMLVETAKAEASALDGSGGSVLHERLRLAMLLGDAPLAAGAFRALGRWIRKAGAGEAIIAALTIVAECVMYSDPDAGWFVNHAPARARWSALPMEDWSTSLTAFLDRQPAETVGKVAIQLMLGGTVTGEALLTWLQSYSELEWSPAWESLREMVEGGDEEDDLDGLLQGIDPLQIEVILESMMRGNRRR
ncbi:hypothetical protein Poly30_28700 [Planctomycetes bacterium Poly30]|uniref:Uncharacterized protein n=1 Tax=Saltatorellus ferox TaxID=2528018 RepID=A0A518ETC6_9BACT|nr:hypothetical protein Poly30_28700 [Planctomycetes bacterium Poly30]